MNRAFIARFVTVTTAVTGAYYFGSYQERKRIVQNVERYSENDGYLLSQKENFLNSIIPKPGLPIFGTVSAAALVPTDQKTNLASTPSRISEIMKHGFPGLDNIRSYSDYVLSYDRRNRIPHWVFEHLTPASVAKNESVNRSKCMFRPDESVHPYFRSNNTDYRGSGFDRGHMAAAGNHRQHQKHCDDTFFLTNMAPQVGEGFNRNSWNRLEMHVRQLTKTYPNVYVCTGPLYLPHKENDGKMYVKYQVIGTNTVAVPTHFYKVIVGETDNRQFEMEAYIMPNQPIADSTPLQVFQVPPETIERSAGLLFFDKINRNQLTKVNGKKA